MIEIFIFFLVAFLYIQIVIQYKSNNDLDVYEIDYFDNTNLQETCKIMQPFLFYYDHIFPTINSPSTNTMDDTICQLCLYEKESSGSVGHPFQVPLNIAKELFSYDGEKEYYSETLLNDGGSSTIELTSDLSLIDPFLKPPFTVQTDYSLLMGSIGCTTPFKYHTNSRKFLVIQSGQVSIKVSPWKSNKKNLHEIHDYQRGEIRSMIDVWNPLPQYQRSIDKIQFLEIIAKKGQVVYIPSYWGYSIKYQEPETILYDFTYSTLFNRLAFLGNIARTWLQQGNIVYKKWPSISGAPSSPPKESSQDTSQELSQESCQELPKEFPKESSQEISQELPKELPKESSQEPIINS